MEEIVKKAVENITDFMASIDLMLDQARIKIKERNILMMPAKSVISMMKSIAEITGERAARQVTYRFGKSAGIEIAKAVFEIYDLKDKLARIIHGSVIFAASGVGFVDILTFKLENDYFESLWECPNSVFVDEFIKGKIEGFNPPVCEFLAGYSAGWIQESTGIQLDAVEIWCRAQGKDKCRFIIAPPKDLYTAKTNPENLKPTFQYKVTEVRL